MKYFFDARFIRLDFHDGVSRFSTELANEVAKRVPVTFLISDERHRAFLPEGAECIKIHANTSWKEPFTALIINKYHPDVVFTPLQTMGSIGRRFKLILTLHDLIYYKFRTPPHYLSAPIRAMWWLYHLTYFPQRWTLNAADAVVTVSQTTRQEMLAARLTKRPIVVVPNAPRDLTSLLGHPASQKQPKNLVYMGSFMPYKNVETLIDGMRELPEYTLHLLSKITPIRQAQLEARLPAGATVIFHNGVSDEKYAELLSEAIYVSASQAEGYGVPIAEALAMGRAAVINDMPIHREVAGDGALYFTATDPTSFAAAIRQLEDSTHYQKITTAGKKHIAKFRWEASAQQLAETMQQLAQRRDT